jgi:hypothetical protein
MALKELKAQKVLRTDHMPPEILKVDLETPAEILHPLFKNIWGKKIVCEEWKR